MRTETRRCFMHDDVPARPFADRLPPMRADSSACTGNFRGSAVQKDAGQADLGSIKPITLQWWSLCCSVTKGQFPFWGLETSCFALVSSRKPFFCKPFFLQAFVSASPFFCKPGCLTGLAKPNRDGTALAAAGTSRAGACQFVPCRLPTEVNLIGYTVSIPCKAGNSGWRHRLRAPVVDSLASYCFRGVKRMSCDNPWLGCHLMVGKQCYDLILL